MSDHPRLSDAVREPHRALDTHVVSRRILAGRVSTRQWAEVRSAWLEVLEPLDELGFLADHARSDDMADEFRHVERPAPVPTAKTYAKALDGGMTGIAGHVWVAYGGLVHGGQIIRDRVPPPHGMFAFDDPSAAKSAHRALGIRCERSDAAIAQAVAAFGWWQSIYDEIERGA